MHSQRGVMSVEPQARSSRKGTKSCLECRHRKVRCVWLSEGPDMCKNCASKGRTCELQVHMMPTSDAVRVTSRARIGHLENEVASLRNAVQSLEMRLGSVPTDTSVPVHLSSQMQTDSKSSDDDSDSIASDLDPANTPSHLLLLFDNDLLGSHVSKASMPSHHMHRRTSALRQLMPSREDMLTITSLASTWMALQNALFPMTSLTKTSAEMLSQYDKLQNPDTDLVDIAALLLSVAITVQQAPDHTAGQAKSIKDASIFIKEVSDTVERIFILDDTLSCTLEGIKTTLIFLRLQLGRARVRKIWLLTRRVIALAELIGLPQAAMALATHQESPSATPGVQGASPSLVESWKQKADVWDSICAIDRIASVMWSLPLATSNYALPKRPVVDSHGQVNAQSYLFHLTDIASHILELDNIYSSGRPIMELFNAVIGTDQELRSLSTLPPKTWRKVRWESLSIDAILQYWHQYFTIRTHLQLALRYEEGQDFAFNFFACLEACQELARRYLSQRLLLPAGFFANRVIDLQVFTATVFLLLASYRTARGSSSFLLAVDIGVISGLVDQVVDMMEIAADRAGGDFARQAASACRSLHALLQQPQTSSAQNITLNLALVGRIHVSRKSSPPTSQVLDERATDLDLMDSLSYSMEIPETYPLLTDEFGSEWLTWTEWNENG